MDVAPDVIDHATLGAARWGRNGWGVAPAHARRVRRARPGRRRTDRRGRCTLALLDHLAALSARVLGLARRPRPAPHRSALGVVRSPHMLAGEARLGFPEPVRGSPTRDGERFAERAPRDVVDRGRRAAHAIRARSPPPSGSTPQHVPPRRLEVRQPRPRAPTAAPCSSTGPTPGEGPACHELAWYLALNRARLPARAHQGVDDRRLPRRPRTARRRHRRLVGPPARLCACSARSCSSAGRRRSATTTSSAGGATGHAPARISCDHSRPCASVSPTPTRRRARRGRRARPDLRPSGREQRRPLPGCRSPAPPCSISAPARARRAGPRRPPAPDRSSPSTSPSGCSPSTAIAGRPPRRRRAALAVRRRRLRRRGRGVLPEPPRRSGRRARRSVACHPRRRLGAVSSYADDDTHPVKGVVDEVAAPLGWEPGRVVPVGPRAGRAAAGDRRPGPRTRPPPPA